MNNVAEDEKYLQELKRLRDNEAKNGRVKKLLDTEILACEKRSKHHKLMADKKQVLAKLQSLEEVLDVTSRTALRQDLVQAMLPLKKEVQRLTEEIVKQEITKAEFKSQLVQCEEILAKILFSLSDDKEFEKQAPKSTKVEENSRWLMLCQAETGLDSHQSGLPTTTITKYAFDESEEFAKIYVDVPGLEEGDLCKLKPTFSERHFSLLVADLAGRNYKVHFTNLTEAIDVEKSKIRSKKDRVVVFLKKKQSITWRSLTSLDSSVKKEALKRVEENYETRAVELVEAIGCLGKCSSEVQREVLLMSNGFYFVRDAQTAEKCLKMMDKFPPKLCNFQWCDKSPGAKEVLCRTVRAVARNDCSVLWINVDSWAEKKRHFDDEHLKLLSREKCQLVNFSGRLSKDGWPLLPPFVVEVTAMVTSAQDITALASCSAVFQNLEVVFPKQLPLRELKPLRCLASARPISLSFAEITDTDVEWLLQAISVLLPLMGLLNQQQVRPAFEVRLYSCQMSVGGHRQLCFHLPPDVVRVEVHDLTYSPQVKALSQLYAIRNCHFVYSDVYDVPGHLEALIDSPSSKLS